MESNLTDCGYLGTGCDLGAPATCSGTNLRQQCYVPREAAVSIQIEVDPPFPTILPLTYQYSTGTRTVKETTRACPFKMPTMEDNDAGTQEQINGNLTKLLFACMQCRCIDL